jgi:hypothetical protein
MADLQGQPGELRMKLVIKRAATGKEETFDVVGHVMEEVKEQDDGGNALDSGS